MFYCPFFEVQLIYNIVLVLSVQQSDSAIYTYIFSQVIFHYRLFQYTVVLLGTSLMTSNVEDLFMCSLVF